MHNSFRMHVFQTTADLTEEFPDGFLRHQFVRSNEVFDHFR